MSGLVLSILSSRSSNLEAHREPGSSKRREEALLGWHRRYVGKQGGEGMEGPEAEGPEYQGLKDPTQTAGNAQQEADPCFSDGKLVVVTLPPLPPCIVFVCGCG